MSCRKKINVWIFFQVKLLCVKSYSVLKESPVKWHHNLAVKNVENLLISTTENGCQDNKSLLDAYKLFDKYLTEKNIERPVVLLADGHSSQFGFKVLQFFA